MAVASVPPGTVTVYELVAASNVEVAPLTPSTAGASKLLAELFGITDVLSDLH